jgi:hypothetical protein
MTERKVSKLEIAREYLDAAIEFFLPRKNLFCAIHLAAAAEELFGKHLPESQRILTFAWKAERAFMSETRLTPINDKEADKEALKRVNKWKNEIKHMDEGACRTVTIDPAIMAEHYIEQALVNFSKLRRRKRYKSRLSKSVMIWKFEDCQNRKVRRAATP